VFLARISVEHARDVARRLACTMRGAGGKEMAEMENPREEERQAASTAFGARMIAMTLFIVIGTFVLFIVIAYYAGFASQH